MARSADIAAITFAIRPVRDFNGFAEHVRGLLDEVTGADLVVFPESFTMELLTSLPGWQSAPLSEMSRLTDLTDPFMELFTEEARRRGQYILAGTHLTAGVGGVFNTAFLFGPTGLVHRHRKTHVMSAEEEWGTIEGDEVEVIELPFAKVGITICYEIEIPELPTALAQQGAEILLCPSFTLGEAGFWRVRHCAAARAVENQTYVVQSGTSSPRLSESISGAWGRSSILSPCDSAWPSPDGILTEQPQANSEGFVRAVVDLDLLQENRSNGAATTLKDRRRRSSLYERLGASERGAVR